MGNRKYDSANTRTISVKLNRKTDADILEKLDTVGPYAGYIKGLIRADMQKPLTVYDPETGEGYRCSVISSETIPGYGTLYFVHLADTGDDFAVILTDDGMQYTVTDWQTADQPTTAEQIPDYQWVDLDNRFAVMLDGLPHSIA